MAAANTLSFLNDKKINSDSKINYTKEENQKVKNKLSQLLWEPCWNYKNITEDPKNMKVVAIEDKDQIIEVIY